jgi:hypothetical protein
MKMNTGIRELNVAELDQVSGGFELASGLNNIIFGITMKEVFGPRPTGGAGPVGGGKDGAAPDPV